MKRKQVKKAIKNCKDFSLSNKGEIPVIWLLIHNGHLDNIFKLPSEF